jgi:hypothetical protein
MSARRRSWASRPVAVTLALGMLLAGCGQRPLPPEPSGGLGLPSGEPSPLATLVASGVPEPSSTPLGSGSPAPAASPGEAAFELNLMAIPRDTIAMQLHLDTDPPSMSQTLRTFCSQAGPPCTPLASPYWSRATGLTPTTVLVYRIERVSTDKQVHVLSQGRVQLGAGLLRSYTYDGG